MGKEYGADGVEITAHALCAEDHLPYQGRQYSHKEFDRIQNTLRRPFGMWNCKHTMFPILLGISQPAHTEAELQAYARNSREEVTIDGVTMSRYEWTQKQRQIETAQKNIATAAKASGDSIARREAQRNINRLTAEYGKISEAAGLIEKKERMTVAGFRRVKAELIPESYDPAAYVDFSAAYSFAKGDTRLTGMLRSGDAQKVGEAVNEILDTYGLKASKWSGRILVEGADSMGFATGRKEWTCDITIRTDRISSIKTFVHENLHSRSVSYFNVETFSYHRIMEEASVEFLAQSICKEAGVPFSKAYSKYVDALADIHSIVFSSVEESTFIKDLFDIDMDKRYTYIVQRANQFKLDTPDIDSSVRDRMNDALRILRGQ